MIHFLLRIFLLIWGEGRRRKEEERETKGEGRIEGGGCRKKVFTDFQFPISHFPFLISHSSFPMFIFISHFPFLISHSPFLIPHFPLPISYVHFFHFSFPHFTFLISYAHFSQFSIPHFPFLISMRDMLCAICNRRMADE